MPDGFRAIGTFTPRHRNFVMPWEKPYPTVIFPHGFLIPLVCARLSAHSERDFAEQPRMLSRIKSVVQKGIANTSLEPHLRRAWGKVAALRTVDDTLTEKILARVVDRTADCIDVGCHVGMVVDRILSLAPDGQHDAFEPLPHYAAFLTKKYRYRANVRVHGIALSDRNGFADFTYNHDHPDYSGFLQREYPSTAHHLETIRVKTARLDDLIDPRRKVKLIKIDVEGAELGTLRGAFELLSRDRPTVIFEHGLGAADYYDTAPEQIFDLLAEARLHVYLLQDFLSDRRRLTRDAFSEQYHRRLHHYFAAAG
jgi:FkbM family methyltransferase